MANIQPNYSKIFQENENPKRMLEIKHDEMGTHAYINFSSLDILQTCMRKAKFALHENLVSKHEHPALAFGSAIHKALEVWYCSPTEHRKNSSIQCDDSHALMLAGQNPVPHGHCARCAAVYAFLQNSEPIKLLAENTARSQENGIEILNNYFSTYLNDPYDILADELGPICERNFEIPIKTSGYRSVRYDVWLFGTIDSVLINRETKELIVCDHKTTSSLGKDFFNRIRPNFQYIGYMLGAQRALGLKTTLFMVNGIQVAKTKLELNRQMISISKDEMQELQEALHYHVESYLHAEISGKWPMSSPNACCMWGGCSYKKICEADPIVQDALKMCDFKKRNGENK